MTSSFSSRPPSRKSAGGTASLRPTISPSPRTSSMRPGWRSLSSARRCRRRRPSCETRSRKPGASRMSSVASPIAMASALPPKVVPCTPTRQPARGVGGGEAGADIGKPPPMPLADGQDVRPDAAVLIGEEAARAPDARSAPRRRSAAGRGGRRSRAGPGGTRARSSCTPPSPWIGSIMIAAVSGPIAASTAARSPAGIWSKPSTFGPKPSRYFFWPPAAMVASVRPWNAPSKVSMRKRSPMAVDPLAAPRHLDRGLVGFGAGIGEEHEIGEGRVDQPAGVKLALRGLIEVRDVPELRALARQRLDHVRMRMADGGDRDAGAEVEIALAGRSKPASSPRRARRRRSPAHRSGRSLKPPRHSPRRDLLGRGSWFRDARARRRHQNKNAAPLGRPPTRL